MTKNPPCNTGEASLIPGWGIKIPHVGEQLSLCAVTTEAHARQLESPCAAVKDPHDAMISPATTVTQCCQISQSVNIYIF